jgi:hypothetical protein
MIDFKPKIWTVSALGLSALSLSALSLVGCQGEAGKSGGEGGAVGAASSATNGVVVDGGETGEAGAATAYAMIAPENRQALRLYHLKGFFLIGQKVLAAEGEEAAGVLILQGLTEVLDPEEVPLKAMGLDVEALRKASQTGKVDDIRAAISAIDKSFAARPKTKTLERDVAFGMAELTSGLYSGVLNKGVIDPTEYQHSLGAALGLKAFIDSNVKLSDLSADADTLVAFWPTLTAPTEVDKITDKSKLVAHLSRMELKMNSLK